MTRVNYVGQAASCSVGVVNKFLVWKHGPSQFTTRRGVTQDGFKIH